MNYVENYRPFNKKNWKGKVDVTSKRYHEVVCGVDFFNEKEINSIIIKYFTIGIIGFACDEGVRRNSGRVGACKGPQALREALGNYPFFSKGESCEDSKFYDFGDVICEDQDLEKAQALLSHMIEKIVKKGIFPVVLGGGHELAWGHYLGLAEAYQKESIGIINIDAHFDLRPLLKNDKGSSGTGFLQMAQWCKQKDKNFDYNCIGIQKLGNSPALFQKAKELGVSTILAEQVQQKSIDSTLKEINEILKRKKYFYLTICLDVFSSAFAPGVSAPQPLGLFPHQVISILEYLAKSNKIIGLDVAELSPPLDEGKGKTAQLAASLLASFFNV